MTAIDWNIIASLVGTIIGSVTGILASNKLTTYRIEQLEKKLDRYADNVDEMRERLVKAESSASSAHKRFDDITRQLNITERRG